MPKARDRFYDRHDWCKECFAAYRQSSRPARKAWLAANQERLRLYRQWYEPRARELVNMRNASIRARTVPFTTDQLAQRLAYYGHHCWICRGPAEHLDHVKPIAAGGPHMLANLRPACARCNQRKNKTWPISQGDLERFRAA